MSNLLHYTPTKLYCVSDPVTPSSIKPTNVKLTDAKNPLYPLKSQWVTVNTWQIKGNWQKLPSLLYRVLKRIWTNTLILRCSNLYTPLEGNRAGYRKMTTSYDPAIPLLGIYPQRHSSLCTRGCGWWWSHSIVWNITTLKMSINIRTAN